MEYTCQKAYVETIDTLGKHVDQYRLIRYMTVQIKNLHRCI